MDRKESNKKHYQKNKKKINEKNKQYNKKNKAKIKEYQRIYYLNYKKDGFRKKQIEINETDTEIELEKLEDMELEKNATVSIYGSILTPESAKTLQMYHDRKCYDAE
jgi:hypothetical protein